MKHRDGLAAAADAQPAELAGGASRLAAANINPNINPMTGFATDYLNHFNEAIMLLDMLPSCPEFQGDLLRWRPVNYCEHFAASHFEIRDAAIAAYENADPRLRADLEALTDAMTSVLKIAREALGADLPPAPAAALARGAVAVLKPLVARAGALINGETRPDESRAIQADVDELMKA